MKVFIRVFIQMDRKSAGHFVSVPKSSRWAARTPPRVVGVHNITKGCCRGASSVPHKTGDNATKQHGVN